MISQFATADLDLTLRPDERAKLSRFSAFDPTKANCPNSGTQNYFLLEILDSSVITAYLFIIAKDGQK